MAIEKIKVTDANVIEQIRDSLPTATNEKKGLLSSDNKVKGGLLLFPASIMDIHPDDYYLFTREGIMIGITSGVTPNWTFGGGCVVHCQRDTISSVTTSQMIFQLFFGGSRVKFRYGAGNYTEIIWESWKDL
ncbi:hypothetical protein [Bacteroides intestinalis]|uniref:hypothetical protein n=1 Tax=Bacteroides intestinalis TaxID=329854 RepID=UPI0018A11893|nr:hypothetical protein [Bacteroides intestinalis]